MASQMILEPFHDTDARIVTVPVHSDERGTFARSWCGDAFAEAGIVFSPVQGNSSSTRKRGSIRGMHFQREPGAEAKLVRVSHGRILDVIADIRPQSPTFLKHFTLELVGGEGRMLYVPAGFAHGFQTLSDDVIVEYLMGERYSPDLQDGFRFDDPAVAIGWPLEVTDISPRDLQWPELMPRLQMADGNPEG